MQEQEFRPECPGRLVAIQPGVQAFVPDPLPPVIVHGPELTRAVADAQEAIGRIDALLAGGRFDPLLLVPPLMKREAYYSSMMEGTFTTPRQMALFPEAETEGGEEAGSDEGTREVYRCVEAMRIGLGRIREQGRPVDHALLLEMHRRLMEGGRGAGAGAGRYRERQNFIGRAADGIGGARYVPPPPVEVRPMMDDLLGFVAAGAGTARGTDTDLPYPIGLALIHCQFEAIHPFEDGNGRIGRLLVPLLLVATGSMREPLLHVSAFMERRKEEYADRLLRVSQRGEWREWILFFLEALRSSALQAREKAEALLSLRDAYLERARPERSSGVVKALVEHLFRRPSITFNEARDALGITHPRAAAHVRRLEELGILEKVGDGKRKARYVAGGIVEIVYG